MFSALISTTLPHVVKGNLQRQQQCLRQRLRPTILRGTAIETVPWSTTWPFLSYFNHSKALMFDNTQWIIVKQAKQQSICNQRIITMGMSRHLYVTPPHKIAEIGRRRFMAFPLVSEDTSVHTLMAEQGTAMVDLTMPDNVQQAHGLIYLPNGPEPLKKLDQYALRLNGLRQS